MTGHEGVMATAGGQVVAAGAGIGALERSWDGLVARFAPYVHAVTMRAYGLPESDAEAAFEEVFLRLWVQLDSRPAVGAALRAAVGATAREVAAERVQAGTPPPSEGVLRDLDDALHVREAMLALEPQDRDLLERRLERGESEAHVARALGMPLVTVAERVREARERLRKEMGWLV